MRQDLTDISIVLDRSGSMESVRSDTIGGVNTFLDGQRATPGAATVSLVQFDHKYQELYSGKPVAEAPNLTGETFVPRGNTALLDAIGRTINATGKRLAAMPEADRPGKVVFVIVTDGQENASKEFDAPTVNKLITHQREAYKWEFIFMGANQDAIAAAGRIGIAKGSSLTYAANAVGTSAAFASATRSTTNYRTGVSGQTVFSADDRQAQVVAGAST